MPRLRLIYIISSTFMRTHILFSFALMMTLIGGLFSQVEAVTNQRMSSSWDQYAYTETAYEGELCGDVDQNAKRGGTYYKCARGLSCDFFEQHSGYVVEPYGRCVSDAHYMCEITGGVLYDDMTCNCPLGQYGGCDVDAVQVTHETEYLEDVDELRVYIRAKNTTGKNLSWSEYIRGCTPTYNDVFGVRVKLIDPPYTWSPISDPQDYYIIGDPWTYYEFMEVGDNLYGELPTSTCSTSVKNTFSFEPGEIKEATLRIPGYILDNAGYVVDAKYGGTYSYRSEEAHAYMLRCDFGVRMQDGVCMPPVTKSEPMPSRHKSSTQSPKNTLPFYDISLHWAQRYIMDLANLGVIDTDRRLFYPNRPINRAEFLKMLLIGFQYRIEDYTPVGHYFRDVSSRNWYADYVYTGSKEGIVEGYGTYFKPQAFITRAEALAMAMRAARIESYAYHHTFFYDVVAEWQKPYIETAYRLNLINGKGDGKFDPGGTLTRAEAAKIVSNIINLEASNVPEMRPDNTESQSTWPRNTQTW